MIRFILNDIEINTLENPATTMLDFVRYHADLKGTKIGCREGDCGACTLLVGELKDNKVIYKSITSCLFPLANASGKHVITVEGINPKKGLNPVQNALCENNGSQCGFCTVGFVMSLCGYALNKKSNQTDEAIASIDGNICRCTGYKSIEKAAFELTEFCNHHFGDDNLESAIKTGIVPSYLKEIGARLQLLSTSHEETEISGWRIAGGTDLYVQKHEEILDKNNIYLNNTFNQYSISLKDDTLVIDGRCTVSELISDPNIGSLIPSIQSIGKLISSTQIRNMATLGGNFVNASPIGDLTILFLALDAQIELKDQAHTRSLPLDQFYNGYKNLNKSSEEVITNIQVSTLLKNWKINFEKVSKRTWLDIASVNSACALQIKDNTIAEARISAGGVGPLPMLLSETSSWLIGKKIDTQVLNRAVEIAQNEVNPISDTRGTASYKKLLLGQLIRAHFFELFGVL